MWCMLYVQVTLLCTHYKSAAGCGFILKMEGGGVYVRVSLYRPTHIRTDSPKHGAQVSITCIMEIRFRAQNCTLIAVSTVITPATAGSCLHILSMQLVCAILLQLVDFVIPLSGSIERLCLRKKESKQSKFAYSVFSLIECAYTHACVCAWTMLRGKTENESYGYYTGDLLHVRPPIFSQSGPQNYAIFIQTLNSSRTERN